MVTVIHRGGYGYAATTDCSDAGLRGALRRAAEWAEVSRSRTVFDYRKVAMPAQVGGYSAPRAGEAPTARRVLLDRLMNESRACRVDERIVDWHVGVHRSDCRQMYLTADGGEIRQQYRYVTPSLAVTAYAEGESQTRSRGGYGWQGGDELLERARIFGSGRSVAEEALELLAAPNCPSGTMDVLLLPRQMMLQIHESIGHPLELDRILGDERNYAGTSFVTLDMFGSYRYGSPLLNVTFDPSLIEEYASYGWDDEGTPAAKAYLIRDGILQRPLGGVVSQARAGIAGVANARACSWNRAPIDRMANLNLEPGASSLEQMISSIDLGVMMDTNRSWSIDDSRNKFQFGCEKAWLIKGGRVSGIVKNPGYRGVSATFWRSLDRVGDGDTFAVMGTPFCGKGEPNQVIHVGHSSPACLFRGVDVFGGEA